MKLAIISDIHANLEALEAVLRDIDAEGVDRIYCLGDVVGYGPSPRQVVDRVRDACTGIVRGNHEEMVTKEIARRVAPIAAKAALWTRRKLEPVRFAPPRKIERWHVLRKLPSTIEVPDDGLLLAHGTPEDAFSYVLSIGEALRVFRRQLPDPLPVCVIGHTHVPGFFFYDGRQIGFGLAEEGRRFERKPDHRLIINAGSVGQPRDQDPRACYLLWHGDGSFEWRRLDYDVDTTCRKIRGIPELPNALAERLLVGE
jgi:diadenosine tetraphosphatase ApaH/serine/threonine PP2A family protein phosphatase